MLRTRLFLGLCTLVLLLWAVGVAGFLILRDASKRFEKRLGADYQAIDIAHRFRSTTSLLNSHYYTAMAAPAGGAPMDRGLYDQVSPDLAKNLELLRKLSGGNERWDKPLQQLEEASRVYADTYEAMFSKNEDSGERTALLGRIANETQRVTDLSNSIATLAEERLFSATGNLVRESGKNLILIATLVVLGTGIAILIYYQLLRHLVDPVVGLKQSFAEVGKGNLDFTLPMPDHGSEFAALVSSFNEMSAELRVRRRETDERLMRKNLLNRALLSAIPSPVYVIADDGSTPLLNPAAEDLNGRLGIGSQLPGKVRRLFDQCAETGQNFRPEDPREALLFRIEERERYFLPRIFRFASEIETYSGWAVLLHDVTRIRWLDDMKSNLLATVSHEIKTPLTGIRMVILLLLEERPGTLAEAQKGLLLSASADCERLLATLNELLDLSRAESGTKRLNLTPIDLSEAARESAALFESQASVKGAHIVMEGGEDIPAVMADPVRLREVINNLVSNAVKHSPDNGTITLRIKSNGADFIRLSVLDEGPGVPVEIQDLIFERFFRAEGQHHDGVGLGLFICREIMRAHEGRIGVHDPVPGRPTEFYIDVPIA